MERYNCMLFFDSLLSKDKKTNFTIFTSSRELPRYVTIILIQKNHL